VVPRVDGREMREDQIDFNSPFILTNLMQVLFHQIHREIEIDILKHFNLF